MGNNYLIISDLQIPYEAPKALKFCLQVKKEFKIPDSCVYNVGDEVDLFHASTHPKTADYDITPKQERNITKEKMKEWGSAFPYMWLCTSNHGIRWARKASLSDIPSEILRDYADIIGAPKNWRWKDQWIIKEKNPFMVMHGLGYNGQMAHRQSAMDMGMSVCHGHLHSSAGISYITTQTQKIFGFNTGCLIDVNSFAFKYGKWSRFKPSLGVGVVINNGSTPIWIPYE